MITKDVLAELRKYPTYGLNFRRYAPFDTFGAVNPAAPGQRFQGDHRTGASTSLKASARTYGEVMFNAHGVVYDIGGSSGSRIHELFYGDSFAIAKISHTVVRTTLSGPRLLRFIARTSGSLPLIPHAPNIDTILNATVELGIPRSMRITGEVFGDSFPNLEVFLVSYGSKHTALLVDGRTTGGRDWGPVLRLPGSHSSLLLAKFSAALPLDQKGRFVHDYKCSPTKLPD